MKFLIKLLIITAIVFVSKDVSAATCTSISRTDNSANTVLTSSKYNTDHNTAYTAINAFDAGCIAAGTIDDPASFDATAFNVWLNSPIAGCKVTNSDANTVSVDRCRIAVGDNLLSTTSATILEISRIIGLCVFASGLLTGNFFLIYLALVCWLVCHRQFYPAMSISEITEVSWQWMKALGRKFRRRTP